MGVIRCQALDQAMGCQAIFRGSIRRQWCQAIFRGRRQWCQAIFRGSIRRPIRRWGARPSSGVGCGQWFQAIFRGRETLGPTQLFLRFNQAMRTVVPGPRSGDGVPGHLSRQHSSAVVPGHLPGSRNSGANPAFPPLQPSNADSGARPSIRRWGAGDGVPGHLSRRHSSAVVPGHLPGLGAASGSRPSSGVAKLWGQPSFSSASTKQCGQWCQAIN